MNRTDFIQAYVVSRTSHKKPIKQLLLEAEEAYEFSVKEDGRTNAA